MNYKRIKRKMYGFTLIEMLIVLIIIGILTVFSLGVSNDQIQKVKNKTVKEYILAEWQSRYSRNLGSSSFSGTIYKHMDIELSSGSNEIKIGYFTGDDSAFLENSFTNRFSIKSIIKSGYNMANPNQDTINSVTLEYTPYRIACKIKNKDGDGELNKITLIVNVNELENADYCFEINNKNCRLIELPISKCETN